MTLAAARALHSRARSLHRRKRQYAPAAHGRCIRVRCRAHHFTRDVDDRVSRAHARARRDHENARHRFRRDLRAMPHVTCATRLTVRDGAIDPLPWLVLMREPAAGALRVGHGVYRWTFDDTPAVRPAFISTSHAWTSCPMPMARYSKALQEGLRLSVASRPPELHARFAGACAQCAEARIRRGVPPSRRGRARLDAFGFEQLRGMKKSLPA